MANRFFTIMIVPEKTSQVRKFIVPSWILKSSLIGALLLAALAGMMVVNYWFVISQISENKQLRLENRRMRQQIQIFENKMATIESTMERVKTFATRLRVITNTADRSDLVTNLNQKLPDAAANTGRTAATLQDDGAPEGSGSAEAGSPALAPPPLDGDPETAALRRDYVRLDRRFRTLSHETLFVEQILQDQYELLADQKAYLAALPTRKPAVGYFTSGFGVRQSPFGERVKMHEGLDIANQPGTSIQATADGVVVFADSKPGYGQTVILDHGYGLETWYAHNRRVRVSKGQKVRRGDPVAELGNSGRSTGAHVHYEVRVNGIPVDPLSFILED